MAARRDTSTAISVRTLVTAALIVLAIVAIVAFLASIVSIVLVVLVAIVFAEGIRPLVADLRKRRIPTPLGILIVYIALLALIALMVLLLVQPIVSEAQSLAANFPTYRRTFSTGSQASRSSSTSTSTSGSRGTVVDATQKILIAIGSTIFSVIVNFVLVLVVGFLWLVSSDR